MSRRRRAGALAAAVLLALVSGAPPAAAAEDSVAPAAAHVTYVTGSSVYVDAGREEGLQQGTEIQVVREGLVIATLRVVFLSAHRAACSIASSSATIVIGDLVRFTPRRESGPQPGSKETERGTGAGTDAARPSRGGLAGLGIRGRVGVRYLAVKNRTANDGGFSQPAFDLRLDGYAVGGGPIDVLADVRSRRTYRDATTGASETDSENRVYRMSVAYHIDPRQQIVVGRQFAPALAVVSLFDGALYSLDGTRTGWGAFSGVQPDAVDFGFSGDIQEYGAYVQFKNAPATRHRWTLTTGFIGSYTDQTVNREFLYLQAQYFGSRLSAYLAEEVDYNRAWKAAEADESTLSPTSTFANFQLRASRRLTFYGGYDNRRSVRLYRDRVTPASVFDDSHRQGAWAGASLHTGEHWFTSADARTSTGGPSGRADGYSASLGVDRLTRANLDVRGRSTRYSNDRSEGWLHSISTGMELGRRLHLDLSAGQLQETNLADPAQDRNTDWYGIDLDVLLGGNWYLLLSGERNRGSQESIDQIYASVTFRF